MSAILSPDALRYPEITRMSALTAVCTADCWTNNLPAYILQTQLRIFPSRQSLHSSVQHSIEIFDRCGWTHSFFLAIVIKASITSGRGKKQKKLLCWLPSFLLRDRLTYIYTPVGASTDSSWFSIRRASSGIRNRWDDTNIQHTHTRIAAVRLDTEPRIMILSVDDTSLRG